MITVTELLARPSAVSRLVTIRSMDLFRRDPKGHVLLVPLLAGLFGFTSQVPNPVFFNLTTKFGVQLSAPVVLLVVWRFWSRIPSVIWRTFGLLLIPLWISTVAASVSASDFPAIYKFAVFTTISFVPLLVAGFLGNECPEAFLKGTAWAILVNVLVGIVQLLYGLKILPIDLLLHVYNNGEYEQDSQSVQFMLRTLRPFGLYPEPSAMSACISPFVTLFAGYLLGLARFPGDFDRACRRLILWATVSGAIFVVISRSGGLVFLAGTIGILFLERARREPSSIKRAAWIAAPLGFGTLSATILVLGRLRGGDSNDALNTSWTIRIGSISQAIQDYINAPPSVVLFGFAGRAWVQVQAETSYMGIYSMLVSYVVNGGLIAMICVARISMYIAEQFKALSSKVVAICCMAMYLTGIGFSTSYLTLAPLYSMLAIFLLWYRFDPVDQPSEIPLCPV